MKPSVGPWLGLDVGGANLKAAHSGGEARSLPFELWKHPEGLSEALVDLASAFPPFGRIAPTTAELCDCFATKAEGVSYVLGAVLAASGGRPVRVWGIDERWHDPAEIGGRPDLAAAANWLLPRPRGARLIPGRAPG